MNWTRYLKRKQTPFGFTHWLIVLFAGNTEYLQWKAYWGCLTEGYTGGMAQVILSRIQDRKVKCLRPLRDLQVGGDY